MEPKILSFLSQIIINIQNAIRKKVAFVHLDENKINLNFNCAIFVTLNPGYAGRTELPMDLKNLFRSISMVVPDAFFITEILLFSAGFRNA
jgi:dynein heavy chain